MDGQLDMFQDLKVKRTRASKEYGAFTDKFKTKLTTDDCYTPIQRRTKKDKQQQTELGV